MGAATAMAGGSGIANKISDTNKQIGQNIANFTSDYFNEIQNKFNYQQATANLESQQAAALYNAKLEDNEAKEVMRQTNEADMRLRDQQAYVRATQRSLYGKSGVALYSGSPLAVQAETAGNQEMESLELRRSGRIQSQRHEQAAVIKRYEADVYESQMDALNKQFKINRQAGLFSYMIHGYQAATTGL